MKETGHEQDSLEPDYGEGKCTCVSPMSDCRIIPGSDGGWVGARDGVRQVVR